MTIKVITDEAKKFDIKRSKKLKEKEQKILKEYREFKAETEKTGPPPLTAIQEKFVNIYCSRYGEKSGTQCAIDAGYNPKGAHTRASELLDPRKNPHVVLEIQNRLAMLREQWDIDRDKHLAMLTKIRDEARIKGQYGVVAKCEELRGKVGGLYIEKSMVLSKEVKDEDSNESIRNIYKTREEFEKNMFIMANELFPDEKSHLYEEGDIVVSEEEKKMQELGKELEEYNEKRRLERERKYKK